MTLYTVDTWVFLESRCDSINNRRRSCRTDPSDEFRVTAAEEAMNAELRHFYEHEVIDW